MCACHPWPMVIRSYIPRAAAVRAPREPMYTDDLEPSVAQALVAQLVERILGKDEVAGSIPAEGLIVASHLTRGG